MPGTLDRMAVPKRPLTVVRRAAVASVVQGGNAGGSTPQAKQSAAGLDAIDLTIRSLVTAADLDAAHAASS